MLDGLLHGRGWIVLVGLLLFGIVFSNVTLLQRNREIAKTAELSTEVKRANEGLRAQLARLGSNQRVQSAAAKRGFALPAPGAVEYLRSGGSKDASRALAQVRGAAQEAPSTGVPGAPVPGAGPETAEQAPIDPTAGTDPGEAAPAPVTAPQATGAPPVPDGVPAAATPLTPGTGQ